MEYASFSLGRECALKDMQAHLEKLRSQIVECELIRDLATNKEKRALFDRIARHHRELAAQIEFAIRRGMHPTRSPGLRRKSRPAKSEPSTL